jgi:hypothetical protein
MWSYSKVTEGDMGTVPLSPCGDRGTVPMSPLSYRSVSWEVSASLLLLIPLTDF